MGASSRRALNEPEEKNFTQNGDPENSRCSRKNRVVTVLRLSSRQDRGELEDASRKG